MANQVDGSDCGPNGPSGRGYSLLCNHKEFNTEGEKPKCCSISRFVLVLLIFTCIFTAPKVRAQFDIGHREPDNTKLQFVTSWGGAVEDVEVVGTTAYAAIGRRLVVLDVEDKSNPTEIGSLDMGNRVLDLGVGNGFLMVITEKGMINEHEFLDPVSVVDISDPTNPHKIWGFLFYNSWSVHNVEMYGDIAYVTIDNNPRFYVFDLSDPANAEYLGRPSYVPGNIRDYKIVDNYLYVLLDSGDAETSNSLHIYDLLTDILYPSEVGVEILGDNSLQGTALAVEGDYAVAILNDFNDTFHDIMKVVDISDPTFPEVVGETNDLYRGMDVVLKNGLAYVADQGSLSGWNVDLGVPDWALSKGLAIFDVAGNPNEPPLVGIHKTHGSTTGLEVVGNTAYTFDAGEGLVLVDITDPIDPVRTGNYYSIAFPRMMERVGDLLYVTDEWNGITILNVANPARPTVEGVYQTDIAQTGGLAGHWGIDVEGDLAYFAAGWNGIYVVDVSDSTNPVFVGMYESWPEGLHAAALELDGNAVHIGTKLTSGLGWFVNYDVTDPQLIFKLGEVFLGDQPLTIKTTSEGISHIARKFHAIVDTSLNLDPILIDQLEPPIPLDCDLDGHLFFMTDRRTDENGGMYIYDVTDPENRVLVSHVPALRGNAVDVTGTRAYFTAQNAIYFNALYFIDVANPNSPVELSKIALPGSIWHPMDIVSSTDDNTVFVSTDVGVQIYSTEKARRAVKFK